jgi:G3E family GTPase
VKEQIAFADVLLLNKIDLVPEAALEALTARIREMNPLARIHRCARGELPLELLLDVGAFDLARALSIDPELLRDATHEHDPSVGSVCLERRGALGERALNRWLYGLVQARGVDLFRMKGILNVEDARRRFVLQGVHMLVDGRPGAPWRDGEERLNQLVFIGRNLDRRELERGFEACLLPAHADRALEVAQ